MVHYNYHNDVPKKKEILLKAYKNTNYLFKRTWSLKENKADFFDTLFEFVAVIHDTRKDQEYIKIIKNGTLDWKVDLQ